MPRIVRVDAASPAGARGPAAEAYRRADVVIGTGDVVLKDRNGIVPRRATPVELAAAVSVEGVLAHGR